MPTLVAQRPLNGREAIPDTRKMSDLKRASRPPVEGEFWLASAPELVASGTLQVERGLLEVRRELVPCMTSRVLREGLTSHSPIDDLDGDYRIYGRAHDGELITIPAGTRGACEHGLQSETQDFHVLQWLVGGHVGEADAFLRLDSEWGLALGDWSGPLTISGIGQVRLITADRGLSVRDLPGLSLSTTLRRVHEPIRALLETMTGDTVAPLRVLVDDARSRTVTVHHASAPAGTSDTREGIFDHARLRNAHVNRWFDIASRTHPIVYVAAGALNGRGTTLEAQTMTLGAVCEGLHEQLHGERSIDKKTVKQLRAAASAAVPGAYSERVYGALAQLGGQTFRDRLTWLADNLEPFATQLCGASASEAGDGEEDNAAAVKKAPRTIWLANTMAARNNFAHQKPDNPHDLDAYVRRSLALRDLVRWFVAACILRELGVPVDAIAGEFKRRPTFQLSMRRAQHVFPEVYGARSDKGGLGFDLEVEQ